MALPPPGQLVPWRASWRIMGGVWRWIAFAVEHRLPVVAAGVGGVGSPCMSLAVLAMMSGIDLLAVARRGHGSPVLAGSLVAVAMLARFTP